MTPDDYGFGLMRRDGVPPRPTYEWLRGLPFNRALLADPVRTLDVEVYLPDRPTPADVEYEAPPWREGMYTLKNVRLDSLLPTVIRLRPR